jgi:hypothetical protein
MAKAKIENASFRPVPAPSTGSRASYNLELWVTRDDDKGVFVAEFPQVAGTRAEHTTRRDAINVTCAKLGAIRNNGGQPKPLMLKALPDKPDEACEVRVIAIS